MSAPAPYRLGSLCSGYGGIEMALRLAGWPIELAFVADPDPAASKVLAHHHPDVPNLGDITRVDWAAIEPVDVLTAGFPCQDISCAGKRAGLGDGTRSGIWANVAKAISILQPRVVLLENVAALLSTKANRSTDAAASDDGVEPGPAGVGDRADQPVLRALGAVLGDLADLGFDATWLCLPAAAVGAPHLRKRVFILAWPAADPPRFGHRDAGPSGVGGVPAATVAGGTGAGELSLLPTPRATDGTKGGPNQRGSSGDLMLPSAVMQLLPTPTAADGERRSETYVRGNPTLIGALLPTPTVADARGSRNATAGRGVDASSEWSPGWSLSDVAYADRWGEYAPAIARWERVVGRPPPDPTELGSKGQPRLSPRFVEWMQGLPEGYVTAVPGVSRNDALKVLGNGVVPQQGSAAINHLAAVAKSVTAKEVAA